MRIAAKFNGPPGSGNGGYSAGLFAGASAGGPTREVTLRRPPPLDTDLVLADGAVRAPDGALVAQVTDTDPVPDPVPPVTLADATAAARGYVGFTAHPFPACYVCGPENPDGLRIFPGPTGPGRTAAPWTVPDDVDAALVWAALDCPGGWAVISPDRAYVLGRLAVTVDALPAAGTTCVVVGAGDGVQGRKAAVRSTLYGPDGTRLATARATWIAVDS
jgi:hypothetical protein